MNKVYITTNLLCMLLSFYTTLSASNNLSKQPEPRYMFTKIDNKTIQEHQETFEEVFAQVQPTVQAQIRQEGNRRKMPCLLRILSYPCKIFCIRNGYL